jgi:hypothetical protein
MLLLLLQPLGKAVSCLCSSSAGNILSDVCVPDACVSRHGLLLRLLAVLPVSGLPGWHHYLVHCC